MKKTASKTLSNANVQSLEGQLARARNAFKRRWKFQIQAAVDFADKIEGMKEMLAEFFCELAPAGEDLVAIRKLKRQLDAARRDAA